MSTVIIVGGGGHNSITRLVVAGATGQMTTAQIDAFQALIDQLQELADEVSPQ